MKRLFAYPMMLLAALAISAGNSSHIQSRAQVKPSRGAGAADQDWPTYGGTLANQRYSALAQINRANVSKLQVAWAFQTGYATPQTSFECTPVVFDGVMYVTSPKNDVYALRADIGEIIWHYDPQIDLRSTKICCGQINRGVAISNGRVFLATLDARLLALDAKTGLPGKEFGGEGEVKIADPAQEYSDTCAPVIADGKVLLGVAGGEFGTRGFFSAYDVETGKLLWRSYTIPAPDEPGGDTWPNTGIHQVAGGPAWMTATVDEESRQVIFGTGNPNPAFNGSARAGDNLYTSSVVALDLDTGKLRWYFQEVKHDLWDYDQSAPPILFNSVINGRKVSAVGAAGKTGWFYIFDRKTGKSLLPMREIAVPQDEKQATSPTQVVPDVPAFALQKNLFAPPTKEGVIIAPGANGASNWSPPAYSPQTELVYLSTANRAMVFRNDGLRFNTPGIEPTGAFVAIDVNTGLVRWRTETNPHPVGGLVATAGGLVFAGASNGLVVAMYAKSGKRLWHFQCGAGVNAAPMTYSVNGRQYVAIAAGGLANERYVYSLRKDKVGQINFRGGDTLFVFALPPATGPSQ